MADSLSIQPVVLSRLTGVSSVAFQRLTTGTATSVSSIFSGTSNTVELSSNGQLLSAVSSFRTRLEALQANVVDSSPGAIVSTTQDLVDAFNRLQGNTASLQSIVTALSGDTLTTQLSRTLSDLVTASLAGNSDTLSNLRSIGINLQTTPAPSGTVFTLSVDPNQLTAAISADPTGTRTALSGAIESFVELATEFESQVVSTTVNLANLTQLGVTTTPQIDLSSIFGLQTNSTAPGIGVATDLLQNLDADTVLNAIQLTDLDLDALGLDADTILAEDSVIRGALVTALLTPNSPATVTETLPASETVGATNQLAGTSTPTAATASAAAPSIETTASTAPPTIEIPIATTQPLVVSTTAASANNPVATSTTLAADVLAAERRAAEAAQALQTLLADPGLRAINNHFDPAYSALIAASHLSDFISPSPVLDPKALLTDDVAPVSPVAMARAIAYYNETSGAKESISLR